MVGVISLVSSHDSPKNPRVLVGERHCRLLPTAALAQSLHPLRDGVIVVFADQNDRLGTLYQQGSQVVATSLGDAAQAGLAAAGILFRCQPQPGTELGTVFELLEVTDCGHHCRRGDDSHSLDSAYALLRDAKTVLNAVNRQIQHINHHREQLQNQLAQLRQRGDCEGVGRCIAELKAINSVRLATFAERDRIRAEKDDLLSQVQTANQRTGELRKQLEALSGFARSGKRIHTGR